MSDNGRTRLTSWKEIAAYLRREVRTVIRWEKDRGLPVHRVPGGQGRSVFAFTDELDRWAAGELPKEPGVQASPARRFRPTVAVATAILIIAAVAAGLARAWPHHEILEIKVEDRTIDAIDTGREVRWSYETGLRHQPLTGRIAQVTDLTGDGHPEAVVAITGANTTHDVAAGALYAFDEDGAVLWQRSLNDRLSFAAGDFDPPWQPENVLAYTSGGEPLIAWSVHHLTWWPSMLAVFNAKGSHIGTFVSAGWIRSTELSADGRHLITGGFTNSRNGAAFTVLDARNPSGATPEDPGSPYECRNCPSGRPLHYFVVDWSDVAATLPTDERKTVVSVHPGTGTIELRAAQRLQTEMIVELSSSFEVKRRWMSDAFWEWHQRLEKNGTLTHPRDRCPYRDGPIVREWSPSAGWKVHGR